MAYSISKLQIIEYQLTDRDKQILQILRDTKCLFTYQIRRVCFTGHANNQAAARAANRNLKRLRGLGLIDALEDRRVGGVRAGSASYIWFLTELGSRLLDLDNKYPEERPKRHRYHEPAMSTLCHQMAINECWVRLKELEHILPDFALEEATFEPANWRYYQEKEKQKVLKPDLAVALSHHGYQYRWFIEIDLSSETIHTLINKCIRYHKYLETNIEQKAHGVFPAVLWIVKDEARKQKLESAIYAKFQHQPNLFLVITADELGKIITARELPEDRLL